MTFQLGTVSHGTLRAQDLIPAFLSALDGLRQPIPGNIEATKYMEYAGGTFDAIVSDDEDFFWDSEDAQYDVSDLMEALNNNLPPYVYFGTQEGDASDFGFWVDMPSLTEDMRTYPNNYDNLSGEVELTDEGVIVLASDIGYVTLMDMNRRVIWSIA